MAPASRQAQLAVERSAHRRRGVERKGALVTLRGGCCSRCGYDKSLRALHFHHMDPSEKTYVHQRSSRFNASYLAQRAWPPPKEFWDEFWACELICANCHMETEEREKHGSTEWKQHIDPAIYAGVYTEQRGMEGGTESRQTVKDGTTTEVKHG